MVDPCLELVALHQLVEIPGLSHHLHRRGGAHGLTDEMSQSCRKFFLKNGPQRMDTNYERIKQIV